LEREFFGEGWNHEWVVINDDESSSFERKNGSNKKLEGQLFSFKIIQTNGMMGQDKQKIAFLIFDINLFIQSKE